MFPGEQTIGVAACVHNSKLLVCQHESPCMTTVQYTLSHLCRERSKGKEQGGAEQAEFLGCVLGSTS